MDEVRLMPTHHEEREKESEHEKAEVEKTATVRSANT